MARSLNLKRKIVVVAHNIRSIHNVGSLFRTLEGLGIDELILSGYSPYPKEDDDKRLEHIASKLTRQINKTALGAENYLKWSHSEDIAPVISKYRKLGYRIYALEQAVSSTSLVDLKPSDKCLVILGNEVEGIDLDSLSLADEVVELPMLGKKESFNVVQAAAMALLYLRL
jgi:tRNA G18 (ribose-2'-O)-methylase SpoU